MRRITITILTALALAAPAHAQALPPAPVPVQDPPAPRMRIGINDNWIGFQMPAGRFSDGLVANGPWAIVADGAPVLPGPLPIGAVGAAQFKYPGVHTLSATGKGVYYVWFPQGIKDAGNLKPTATANLFTATFTGTETYTCTPAGSWARLTVQATDATAPLLGARFLEPGGGPGLYHPRFVDSLTRFACIRVMDPQGTPGSGEIRWADRSTRPGFDLESLISLANQTSRDIWICIPHQVVSANGAPTDWCTGLGDLIDALVSPKITVYLEYSDEVWNYNNPWFRETNWAHDQALREYLPLDYRQWYARAAHAAFGAVESRIGPHGPRIRRVFAGQLANTATIDNSLSFAAGKGYRFDALAGGMYWGWVGDAAAVKAAWTAGDQAGALQLVDQGFRAGASVMLGWVKAYAARAQQYGLDLVAYEGGPDGGILWRDPSGLPIMRAYVRSPLCRQQHLDTFAALDAAGVSLIMYYSHCHPDPTWTALDGPTDVTNRKYRSAVEYQIGAPPAIYLGQDTTTQGNWVGTYGTLGATVAGVPAQPPAPGVAAVTPVAPPKASSFTNAAPGTTTDPRAPQLPDGSGRVAGVWYSPTEVDLDIPAPADGSLRVLSLYFLEWKPGADNFSIQLVNADNGAVLDTRPVPSPAYNGGVYLRWVIEGHVQVAIRRVFGNAHVSGIFLDPVPAP